MRKKIVNQVQEAQKVPGRINPRRNTLRHSNQTNKIKNKGKILKATREKKKSHNMKGYQLISQQKLNKPERKDPIYLK